MKFTKVLPLFILSVFLLNGVAAVTSYASWGSDELQSATITNGQSINFGVDFFAMNPPMNLRVELYDSSNNLIYTFLNQRVSTQEYTTTYTIDKSIYGNVGDFNLIINGADAHSSQSHEITLKVNPVPADTTAPVITIIGSNPQTITQGNSYVELGATALDNIDGNLTSNITIDSSNVNANVVGNYSVVYSVSDAAGNHATATRIVNVIASTPIDTTTPTITIQSPINGSTYNFTNQFLNFIATDNNLSSCAYSTDNGTTKISTNCSSGILKTISLNASEGTNTWIVYASDTAGNQANASITFSVDTTAVDITAPVITIISPNANQTINSRNLRIQLTTDEDATVTLSLDNGSLKLMNNAVDHIFTYSLIDLDNGNHTLKFTATDTAGNAATKDITFNVNKKSSGSSGMGTIASEISTSKLSNKTNKIVIPQGDVKILDDVSLTKKVSFFQKIIDAIVNFFKKLFGIK
jgi:hypothetical protein